MSGDDAKNQVITVKFICYEGTTEIEYTLPEKLMSYYDKTKYQFYEEGNKYHKSARKQIDNDTYILIFVRESIKNDKNLESLISAIESSEGAKEKVKENAEVFKILCENGKFDLAKRLFIHSNKRKGKKISWFLYLASQKVCDACENNEKARDLLKAMLAHYTNTNNLKDRKHLGDRLTQFLERKDYEMALLFFEYTPYGSKAHAKYVKPFLNATVFANNKADDAGAKSANDREQVGGDDQASFTLSVKQFVNLYKWQLVLIQSWKPSNYQLTVFERFASCFSNFSPNDQALIVKRIPSEKIHMSFVNSPVGQKNAALIILKSLFQMPGTHALSIIGQWEADVSGNLLKNPGDIVEEILETKKLSVQQLANLLLFACHRMAPNKGLGQKIINIMARIAKSELENNLIIAKAVSSCIDRVMENNKPSKEYLANCLKYLLQYPGVDLTDEQKEGVRRVCGDEAKNINAFQKGCQLFYYRKRNDAKKQVGELINGGADFTLAIFKLKYTAVVYYADNESSELVQAFDFVTLEREGDPVQLGFAFHLLISHGYFNVVNQGLDQKLFWQYLNLSGYDPNTNETVLHKCIDNDQQVLFEKVLERVLMLQLSAKNFLKDKKSILSYALENKKSLAVKALLARRGVEINKKDIQNPLFRKAAERLINKNQVKGNGAAVAASDADAYEPLVSRQNLLHNVLNAAIEHKHQFFIDLVLQQPDLRLTEKEEVKLANYFNLGDGISGAELQKEYQLFYHVRRDELDDVKRLVGEGVDPNRRIQTESSIDVVLSQEVVQADFVVALLSSPKLQLAKRHLKNDDLKSIAIDLANQGLGDDDLSDDENTQAMHCLFVLAENDLPITEKFAQKIKYNPKVRNIKNQTFLLYLLSVNRCNFARNMILWAGEDSYLLELEALIEERRIDELCELHELNAYSDDDNLKNIMKKQLGLALFKAVDEGVSVEGFKHLLDMKPSLDQRVNDQSIVACIVEHKSWELLDLVLNREGFDEFYTQDLLSLAINHDVQAERFKKLFNKLDNVKIKPLLALAVRKEAWALAQCLVDQLEDKQLPQNKMPAQAAVEGANYPVLDDYQDICDELASKDQFDLIIALYEKEVVLELPSLIELAVDKKAWGSAESLISKMLSECGESEFRKTSEEGGSEEGDADDNPYKLICEKLAANDQFKLIIDILKNKPGLEADDLQTVFQVAMKKNNAALVRTLCEQSVWILPTGDGCEGELSSLLLPYVNAGVDSPAPWDAVLAYITAANEKNAVALNDPGAGLLFAAVDSKKADVVAALLKNPRAISFYTSEKEWLAICKKLKALSLDLKENTAIIKHFSKFYGSIDNAPSAEKQESLRDLVAKLIEGGFYQVAEPFLRFASRERANIKVGGDAAHSKAVPFLQYVLQNRKAASGSLLQQFAFVCLVNSLLVNEFSKEGANSKDSIVSALSTNEQDVLSDRNTTEAGKAASETTLTETGGTSVLLDNGCETVLRDWKFDGLETQLLNCFQAFFLTIRQFEQKQVSNIHLLQAVLYRSLAQIIQPYKKNSWVARAHRRDALIDNGMKPLRALEKSLEDIFVGLNGYISSVRTDHHGDNVDKAPSVMEKLLDQFAKDANLIVKAGFFGEAGAELHLHEDYQGQHDAEKQQKENDGARAAC